MHSLKIMVTSKLNMNQCPFFTKYLRVERDIDTNLFSKGSDQFLLNRTI